MHICTGDIGDKHRRDLGHPGGCGVRGRLLLLQAAGLQPLVRHLH